jgi:acetyl-CoA carboxylase biotin carboxyl carrier protein
MVPVRPVRTYRPAVHTESGPDRPPVDIVRRNTRSGGGVAQVEAHITGTVWKIEVGVGDAVEEGDTVVILESMKMEMPVEAEDEGTVTAILVQEGQAVSEGDPLVELS